MPQERNHLNMEILPEHFRRSSKIFSNDVLMAISKFRHLQKEQQDQLINKLDMDCLYVTMFLKQHQKRLDYIRSNSKVAKRYD